MDTETYEQETFKLRTQLAFLTDLFASRDAMQRAQIEHLEQVVQQQAHMIVWYKATAAEGQPFGVKQ